MVVFKFGKHLPGLVLGDRFRVEHVISNLLSNAIKFSPDGKDIVIDITGVALKPGGLLQSMGISSRTDKVKHEMAITIAITDEGPGISSANQSRLFNNFVQIRPQQLQMGQGSGLGLALCKAIVELHNGTIGVRHMTLIPATYSTSTRLLELDHRPCYTLF